MKAGNALLSPSRHPPLAINTARCPPETKKYFQGRNIHTQAIKKRSYILSPNTEDQQVSHMVSEKELRNAHSIYHEDQEVSYQSSIGQAVTTPRLDERGVRLKKITSSHHGTKLRELKAGRSVGGQNKSKNGFDKVSVPPMPQIKSLLNCADPSVSHPPQARAPKSKCERIQAETESNEQLNNTTNSRGGDNEQALRGQSLIVKCRQILLEMRRPSPSPSRKRKVEFVLQNSFSKEDSSQQSITAPNTISDNNTSIIKVTA